MAGRGAMRCLAMEVQSERGRGQGQDLCYTHGGLRGVSINVCGRIVGKLLVA